MLLALLLLLSGLTISAVAIYYSVIGLAAIFAGATIPIYIMGISLEVAKLIGASWLKSHWGRAPMFLKTYMAASILVLMMITSMGIFGFLSKSHLDQAVPTGTVVEQVKLFDEKIAIERENVNTARTALQQLDNQVTELLSRSNDTAGANRAVIIRKQQAQERKQLQAAIETSQEAISRLQAEKAPLASKLRQVEAEVGPLKYIAALIYGSEPDASTLEKAVTWMIILIVAVFDPLAVALLLAAQVTFSWRKADKESKLNNADISTTSHPVIDSAAGIHSTNDAKPVVSDDNDVSTKEDAVTKPVAVINVEVVDSVAEPLVVLQKVEDAPTVGNNAVDHMQQQEIVFSEVKQAEELSSTAVVVKREPEAIESANADLSIADTTTPTVTVEESYIEQAATDVAPVESAHALEVVTESTDQNEAANVQVETSKSSADSNTNNSKELVVEEPETLEIASDQTQAEPEADVIINSVGQSKKKFMIKQSGNQVSKTIT